MGPERGRPESFRERVTLWVRGWHPGHSRWVGQGGVGSRADFHRTGRAGNLKTWKTDIVTDNRATKISEFQLFIRPQMHDPGAGQRGRF